MKGERVLQTLRWSLADKAPLSTLYTFWRGRDGDLREVRVNAKGIECSLGGRREDFDVPDRCLVELRRQLAEEIAAMEGFYRAALAPEAGVLLALEGRSGGSQFERAMQSVMDELVGKVQAGKGESLTAYWTPTGADVSLFILSVSARSAHWSRKGNIHILLYYHLAEVVDWLEMWKRRLRVR